MKFYKRDPDRAMSGMAELTFKQRGAYNSIIDLLYARDGDVADDDVRVAKMLSAPLRSWKAIKHELIALQKLWIVDGKIHAKRVQETINEAVEFGHSQSRRASERWTKEKIINKNNGPAMPHGTANTPTPTPTPTPKQVVPKADFSANVRKVDRLGQALGFDITTKGPRFVQDLVRLEMDGFDFDLDILPTVEAVRRDGRLPRDLGSLAYFRKPIEAARDARRITTAVQEARANAPLEPTDEAGWWGRLRRWLESGYWPPQYGPRPRGEGCLAPAEAIRQALEVWGQQGGHPRGAFPADPNGRFTEWKDLRDLRESPDVDYGNRALNVVAIPRRIA